MGKRVRGARSWRWVLIGAGLLAGCKSCKSEPQPIPDAGAPPRVTVTAPEGALCWRPLEEGLVAPVGAVDFLDLSLAAKGDETLLAWADKGLVLKRYAGAGPWSLMPLPDGAGWGAARPSLALDAEGHPLLAWEEDEESGSGVRVARLQGETWSPVGGALGAYAAQGTAASEPVLLGGSAPVVMWTELEPGTGPTAPDEELPERVPDLQPAELPGQALWAAHWTGEKWDTGKAALQRGSDLVSLEASAARDAQGVPWLAWVGGREATETYVRVSRLVDGSWQDVAGTAGAFLKGSGATHRPQLAPIEGGMLLVWRDGDGGRAQIAVARFTGEKWERLAAPVPPAADATIPSGPVLAAGAPGAVWAAWTERTAGRASTVTLAEWKDGAWQRRLTGLTREATPEGVRALAITTADPARPVLAWDEPRGSGSRLHVVRVAACEPGEVLPQVPPPAAASAEDSGEEAPGGQEDGEDGEDGDAASAPGDGSAVEE